MQYSYFNSAEILQLINTMQAIPNHEFRFVGGCVRDALLNITPKDFDLASSLEPDVNIKNFKHHKIKVLDFAKDYGTITAIINGKTFEITSLRKDIQTFGRKAKVQFSTSFLEDANRRDLTINVLYFNPINHTIDDFFDGITDLYNGKIRFIGDINQRLQEDYLRILRFVRFYTFYGKIIPSSQEISTLQQNITNLQHISKERITEELNKILSNNTPSVIKGIELLNNINACNILFKVPNLNTLNLQNLLNLSATTINTIPLNHLLKLMCLIDGDFTVLTSLYNKKQEKYYIKNMLALKSFIQSYPEFSSILSQFSFDIIKDFCLYAISTSKANQEYYVNLLDFIQQKLNFNFPVTGADLLKLGFASNQQLGKALKWLKAWGINQPHPTKTDYLNQAKLLLLKKDID